MWASVGGDEPLVLYGLSLGLTRAGVHVLQCYAAIVLSLACKTHRIEIVC